MNSPVESQNASVSFKVDRLGVFGNGKSSEHIENSQGYERDKAVRMKV